MSGAAVPVVPHMVPSQSETENFPFLDPMPAASVFDEKSAASRTILKSSNVAANPIGTANGLPQLVPSHAREIGTLSLVIVQTTTAWQDAALLAHETCSYAASNTWAWTLELCAVRSCSEARLKLVPFHTNVLIAPVRS
jgi:hypothetical protein